MSETKEKNNIKKIAAYNKMKYRGTKNTEDSVISLKKNEVTETKNRKPSVKKEARSLKNNKPTKTEEREKFTKIDIDKLPAVSRKTRGIAREVKPRRSTKDVKKYSKGLKIIPLGGLEHIGMNITAFEFEDSIIVVDCGMSFPDDDMLGIDCVIPNISYLKKNFEKVKGFVITHGHEDHIGALPYILKELNIPIYATRLTVAIIESKLSEKNMLKNTKRKIVKYGQSINLGCFRIEFIRTNHSISDAAALAIYSPVGTVVHTGDFKVDYTPVFGDPIDLQRFGEIGRKGVLALMCESTNVLRPGFTMSEKSVGKTFDNIFAENRNSRIIVATFASNVDRVQQIINSAENFGRKVVVEGRSMINIISIARELGYITLKENTIIDVDRMREYPDEQLVLITTGSQGEAMAALSRMAASIHKKITINKGDTIVFSSTPIPGNEKSVSRVMNELYQQGAKVIFQDAHVSGHACQEEIKLMYSLIKPKFSIPIHGEYRHLVKHSELAMEMGIPKENVFVLKCGDVLELKEDGGKVVEHIECKGIMVDGLGIGDVGNSVMRDRQKLSEDGLIVVSFSMEKGSNEPLSNIEIVTKGFTYVRESDGIIRGSISVVNDVIDRCISKGIVERNRIKNEVRDGLSEYIWKQTKRSPMIITTIADIEY